MNRYDEDFWNALDKLVNNSEIIIDDQKERHILNIPILFIGLITDI